MRLAYLRSARDAYVLRHLPEQLARMTVSGNEEKSVYYVWNMDIFLTKTHGFTTGGLYSPPGAMWGMFYYRCTHFISHLLDCWQNAPAYPHCKAWRGQDNFLCNSDWIRLKEESPTPRMLRGWVHRRLIFIFGWTNPLTYWLFISTYKAHILFIEAKVMVNGLLIARIGP